ncbi:MAG TPA: hypothetical protein VN200_02415, partial [Rhodoglobus sp.]|nr:hypothetical protein [Rhodoglobus sp.]
MTGIVPEGDSSGEFGANEWLVDEMYELFQKDRNLVDKSWWPTLEHYHRVEDPTPTSAIPVVQQQEAPRQAEQPAPREAERAEQPTSADA